MYSQFVLKLLCHSHSISVTSYQSLIVTLAVSGTVFEILTLKARKWLILPTTALFEAPARGEPLIISA